jgi:hypothetical protein
MPPSLPTGGEQRFTTRQVEEVKLVLRMLPVFFTTIIYWTIYQQVGRLPPCAYLSCSGVGQRPVRACTRGSGAGSARRPDAPA